MIKKLLIALTLFASISIAVQADRDTSKIYVGDGAYTYEHDVRSPNILTIGPSVLTANGNLLSDGTYYIADEGLTLTTPANPYNGATFTVYKGDNGDWASSPVIFTNGSDAALIEDSTSDFTASAANLGNPYNGATLKGVKGVYVGPDEGWRMIGF